MKILANRDSVQGLITYYISLIIFVVSCIGISESTDPLRILVFVLSLTTMMIQDFNWIRRSRIHPHDMKLIDELTKLIQLNKTDKFLKDHDFVTYIYDDHNLKPLEVLDLDWNGVDYEFVNSSYQAHWSGMKQKLKELMKILIENCSMKGMNFYHMLPAKESRDNDPDIQRKIAKAETANQLARDIYNDFQMFRKLYLKNREITR